MIELDDWIMNVYYFPGQNEMPRQISEDQFFSPSRLFVIKKNNAALQYLHKHLMMLDKLTFEFKNKSIKITNSDEICDICNKYNGKKLDASKIQ